ncbi:hypothetical protein [Nocardia callitridis]|uniref:hypothetical protein n=1 Tax=Nocardia callitridis TaxID=648753 RepID=UPI0031EFF0F4
MKAQRCIRDTTVLCDTPLVARAGVGRRVYRADQLWTGEVPRFTESGLGSMWLPNNGIALAAP